MEVVLLRVYVVLSKAPCNPFDDSPMPLPRLIDLFWEREESLQEDDLIGEGLVPINLRPAPQGDHCAVVKLAPKR